MKKQLTLLTLMTFLTHSISAHKPKEVPVKAGLKEHAFLKMIAGIALTTASLRWGIFQILQDLYYHKSLCHLSPLTNSNQNTMSNLVRTYCKPTLIFSSIPLCLVSILLVKKSIDEFRAIRKNEINLVYPITALV